jgi:hypothetical protein
VRSLSALARRHGFDVLIVVGAIEAALGEFAVRVRLSTPDGPL